MRFLLLAVVILNAVLVGCSKHASEAAAPATLGQPPALLATQPVARTASAAYDGEIWAQFDRALEDRTVTPLTVFLKVDGQRVKLTVNYDGVTHRVFLHPAVVLELQRTYTVEFSPGVKGVDGTPLPAGVFYQFTTNSLRRIAYDYPAEGALEGPVACLGWGGTKGPDGNVFYELYASPESAKVARRAIPSLQRSVFTRFLCSTRWPLGTRMWWAVTSENLSTHERMDGDMHSFRVLDAATPLDSVVIRASDNGSNDVRSANLQFCNSASLPAGPGFNAGLHWSLSSLGAGARVASATLRLFFVDANAGNFNATQPSLWQAQNDWSACTMRAPGPPYNEQSGLLATAVAADSIRNDFTSDRLAAFLEAQYRRRTLVYGTLLRTQANASFHSDGTATPGRAPRMVVRYYRLPPGVLR